MQVKFGVAKGFLWPFSGPADQVYLQTYKLIVGIINA